MSAPMSNIQSAVRSANTAGVIRADMKRILRVAIVVMLAVAN
jgi:hypothetical protein